MQINIERMQICEIMSKVMPFRVSNLYCNDGPHPWLRSWYNPMTDVSVSFSVDSNGLAPWDFLDLGCARTTFPSVSCGIDDFPAKGQVSWSISIIVGYGEG